MVVDLDEGDVERVRLVVDPLQALQHTIAAGAPVGAVDCKGTNCDRFLGLVKFYMK